MPKTRTKQASRSTTTPDPVGRSLNPAAAPVSTHQQIAALAYRLWCERGCPHGSAEDDWFRAEQQIQAESEPQEQALTASGS